MTQQTSQKISPTVAVITSTIGRPELERAIISVQQQSYAATHYVFVDGEQYWQQAKAILDKYPDVVATYLPMNTGANGWTNSSINAIAPYLVKSDVICYLDDDNWYEPNHIATGLLALYQKQADYAFALRSFYDERLQFICVDLFESIGHYPCGWQPPFRYDLQFGNVRCPIYLDVKHNQHIDTNCYFMRTEVARQLSQAWYSGKWNDNNVYHQLKQQYKGVCSGAVTVNYVADLPKIIGNVIEHLQKQPFELTAEQAHEIVCDMLRKMSQDSWEGWGGVPIWLQDT